MPAAVRYRHDHNDELAAALADVLAKIDRWRQLAHRRPLAEVLWQIYDESGYLAFGAGYTVWLDAVVGVALLSLPVLLYEAQRRRQEPKRPIA